VPSTDQQQAQLALQGLAEAPAAPHAEPPLRVYDGPGSPESLLAHLGYADFRPGQRDAVEAALGGRDALIVMPTGGGKSLCYQLPGIATSGLTIVVSPLIALMADQWRRLSDGGHPAVMVASGLGQAANASALQRVRDGSARIVYCSPERFGSVAFLDALSRREISLFAIDEAHCLSEWGHDFRPDYLWLPKAIERLGRPPVMACTATATEDVAQEVTERLGLRDPLAIRSGFDRPNLSFDIVCFEGKGSKGRKLALLQHGLRDPANRPGIVYCGTRRDTEEVADALRGAGLLAVGYHAGMAPDERASAQHRFMNGDAEIIAATNAFGMGVDKANVRSVWHWAIPTSVEAYYQEAGRGGRDGEPARAVLLAGRSDLGRLVRFIERRNVDPDNVEAFVAKLRAAAERAAGSGYNGDPAGDGGSGGVSLVIDSPRDDENRIRLAIAERVGACVIEPAGGGRLSIELTGALDRARTEAACRFAKDRGWRAYRAVEAFSFSDSCRRRMLLTHFADTSDPEPTGRCCDVCDPDPWLPDPATIAVPRRPSRRAQGSAPAAAVELSEAEEALFEELRAWRVKAADGKPAYTIAHDRTLREIAAARPADANSLGAIRGVGPTFVSRYAETVLELVSRP